MAKGVPDREGGGGEGGRVGERGVTDEMRIFCWSAEEICTEEWRIPKKQLRECQVIPRRVWESSHRVQLFLGTSLGTQVAVLP